MSTVVTLKLEVSSEIISYDNVKSTINNAPRDPPPADSTASKALIGSVSKVLVCLRMIGKEIQASVPTTGDYVNRQKTKTTRQKTTG